jgi:hypothetical protein
MGHITDRLRTRIRTLHSIWRLGRLVSHFLLHISFQYMLIVSSSAGWQLWYMFIHLDSIQYPLKTYGDVAYRVYGPWARHCVNSLQSLVLVCIVSGVILSSGQSIAQISKNKICYVICIFIYAVAGMILGQIRPLRNVGWMANLAVWINLLIMFIV